MSAYGDIKRAPTTTAPLPSTAWSAESHSDDPDAAAGNGACNGTRITVHHLTLASARALPGLLDHLGAVFAQEVADGRTYPQEGAMPQTTFEAYFFAADVFVGIVGSGAPTATVTATATADSATADHARSDIAVAQAGRAWAACVAGYYYIKPNYPGRSSHICNAGFVVPPSQRGKGFGSLLSRSYVHYAPRLGYEASVFNLVYVNNRASVRLWEKLGFVKAGLIPRAGRLRTEDGQGEEYVDAWVFYKSFIDAETEGPAQRGAGASQSQPPSQ